MNHNEEWKNNTYIYYKWWLSHCGFHYLNRAQIAKVKEIMSGNPSNQWYVDACRKALSQRSKTSLANVNARLVGYDGERAVRKLLESYGWEILKSPEEALFTKPMTSTSGYDFVVKKNDLTLSLEVKSFHRSSPLWTMSEKNLTSIRRAETDYVLFVKVNKNLTREVYYCAVQDLRFLEPVYMHDALNYDRKKAFKHLLVINPKCFNKISRKEVK